MPPQRSKQYSRSSRARKPSAITGKLGLDDIAVSPEMAGRNASKGKNPSRKGDQPGLDGTMEEVWSDPPAYDKPPPDERIIPDTFQDDLEDCEVEMKTSSPHTLLERSLLPPSETAATSAYSQRTVAVMGDDSDFLFDQDEDGDNPPSNGDSPPEDSRPHGGPSQAVSQAVELPRQPTKRPSKPKKVKQMAKIPFSQESASKALAPRTNKPAAKPSKAPVKPVKAPVKPAKAPIKPAKAQAQPAKAPVKSAKAPVEPAEEPGKPAKKLKLHQQMQTYDKTPSPLTEQDKPSGSSVRRKRKQPARARVLVVPDDSPEPVQEKPKTQLLNKHSLRKPHIISFSPDGPLNSGRPSPQKRKLEASNSSREAKRPRTNASTTTKKVPSPAKQQPAVQDETDNADVDDDMGMPAESCGDSSDYVPEPTKQRSQVEQLPARELRHSETAAHAHEPTPVASVSSHFAEALQRKGNTTRQTSYRPPVRRSSRVDETGSPGPSMGDVVPRSTTVKSTAVKNIAVKSNEKLATTSQRDESKRQPPPEFRIDLTQSTPPAPKSEKSVSPKTVSSKPVVVKPAAPKPAAPKPVSSKLISPRPVAPKPVSKPVDPKPVSSKAVAPKPDSLKPTAPESVSQKPVALKSIASAPVSLNPVSTTGEEQPFLAAERGALPKLAYHVASPEPTASTPLKPPSNNKAGRSSHVTDRKALPTLTYRPASHQDGRPQPVMVEEVIRNVEPEPVASNMIPQVSSKFLQGFKQALLPVDQNRKLEQETRQGQSKYTQRTPMPSMQDGRHGEMHAPTAEKRGQTGSSRPSRDQNRQGRVPDIYESNLHVVVPAIIEIFLEKLRHKEGVVEKVAKLYAGNGNKLVEELRGSHYKDQRVLAETYDHRRQEFMKKCDKTMRRVQSIRDAMDGCGGDVASSPDLRTAAVERAMARLREARA